MQNKTIIFGFIFIALLWVVVLMRSNATVYADWWDRPTDRPTPPSEDRNLPTQPPQPTNPLVNPTSPVNPTSTQPSPTPRVGSPTTTPSNGGNDGDGSHEDACASGKSYTGEYCGWSPRIGGGENNGGGSSSSPTVPVLGLSYTSGYDLGLSDIMLLSGVLCLLLYVRSKVGSRQV